MSIRLLLTCLAAAFAFLAQSHAAEPRLLFVGNSITLHGKAEKIGWLGNWGMAASAEEKDYVHLIVDAIAKASGSKPEFRVVNLAAFERDYEKFDFAAALKDATAFKPEIVILAIGENVPGLASDTAKTAFTAAVTRLLTHLKGDHGAQLYVRSSFWANPAKDAALREACTKAGGVLIDISALGKDESNYARSERKFDHEGVARHPGDKGMKAIADAIVAAIRR